MRVLFLFEGTFLLLVGISVSIWSTGWLSLQVVWIWTWRFFDSDWDDLKVESLAFWTNGDPEGDSESDDCSGDSL